MADAEQTRKVFDSNGIRTVIAAGVDQVGILRGKRFTVPAFLASTERGFHMPWSLLKTGTMDDAAPGLLDGGVPDAKAIPDLSTLRLAPWEKDAAIVLMDWHWADGSPCPLCPRSLLRQQVGRAREMGLEERFALELEFFLLPTPVETIRRGGWSLIEPGQKDVHCYSIYEGHFHERFFSQLRECFSDAIEGGGPEWGRGQFEINLRPRGALEMADTAVIFKTAVKQIAAQLGMSATFMAKWHEDHTGSSGHIHQSFQSTKTGRSAFYDESAQWKMSEVFRQYTAGQLEALIPATLFFAPFVNSYKRFRVDSLAGVTESWGIDNRTVSLRVLNSSPAACRLENRVGGADLNPYLAFSTCLGAGLRGVAKKLALPPPVEGNAYRVEQIRRVPRNLEEAIQAADRNPITRDILPPAVVDNLLVIARMERDVFDSAVTDLERRRYFEMA
jgi:glutamine synthetase